MKLKPKSKNMIDRAAGALALILNEIQKFSPDELRVLIAKCDSLTQTNCWWLEYRLAPLIKQEAVECLSFVANEEKGSGAV